MEKAVLMSIKPKYAKKIYSGEKTVELRKSFPKYLGPKNNLVIIYETRPVMAVTGCFWVENVAVNSDPEWLYKWLCVGYKIGITYQEYKRYYRDANKAVALLIDKTKKADNQIALKKVKEIVKGFRPPQSYYYIDEKQTDELLKHMNICEN